MSSLSIFGFRVILNSRTCRDEQDVTPSTIYRMLIVLATNHGVIRLWLPHQPIVEIPDLIIPQFVADIINIP